MCKPRNLFFLEEEYENYRQECDALRIVPTPFVEWAYKLYGITIEDSAHKGENNE